MLALGKIKVRIFLFAFCAHNAIATELTSMDLEQLMEMNVTTVSKRVQKFSSAAAAIYTITNEDIRRSAATTLPEILRQAPGVEVARLNTSVWAVSARGFNGQFANKLLVLIDGRAIYNQLFSGVYWDEQVPSLEDIQRIEVIRGPGASLWGSNAVNGVINIITYDAEQTQGSRFTVGAGNEEKFTRIRHGFRGERYASRINFQHRKTDEYIKQSDKQGSNDEYAAYQLGARLDLKPDIYNVGALDVGITKTKKDMIASLDYPIDLFVFPEVALSSQGGWMTGSWLHELNNEDSVYVQSYIDSDRRVDPLDKLQHSTWDTELQYNFRSTDVHRVTTGLNHRKYRDDFDGSFFVEFSDGGRSYSQTTGFFQDEMRVFEGVTVVNGLKLEKNSVSDIEHQPSSRISWQLDDATFWWSISRAVRNPSHSERTVILNDGLPPYFSFIYDYLPLDSIAYVRVLGNQEMKSEKLYAYESGFRWKLNDELYFDAAAYLNDYKRLRNYLFKGFDIDDQFSAFVLEYDNNSTGRSEGVEFACDYRPGYDWRMKFSYSYHNFNSYSDVGTVNDIAKIFEHQSPLHQVSMISYHEISHRLQFDWTLRHVDELYDGAIPRYSDVDVRLGWLVDKNISVSLVGKDIFSSPRVEFADTLYGPVITEIQKSFFIQFEWR